MAWYNPWAEIRHLRKMVENYEKAYAEVVAQCSKLKFTKKENEREIEALEQALKTARAALAEASKNDTRDSKGRFTKAKK